MDHSELAAEIRREIGSDRVVDDRDIVASFENDWTGRFKGHTSLVVRPTSTEELAVAVERTTAAGMAIVPQGGNTGLVGGGIPRGGEVVVSTQRMVALEPISAVSEVIVSAGVTLAALQQHARERGLEFGVDLASRDSATVGGMIATNAGGTHTIRWGRMRAQVLGIEVVMHDGQILDQLDSHDQGALDLSDLFIGSEGTLGIITRARLRLIPSQRHVGVVLLAMESLESAAKLATRLRNSIPEVRAVEYFGSAAVDLVRKHRGTDTPFSMDEDAYLLVEASANDDPLPSLHSALDGVTGIKDSAVAIEPGPRQALWELREGITEAINSIDVPRKYDVWVPPTRISQFEESLLRIVERSGGRLVLFGHLAAGALHANVLGVEPTNQTIDEATYRLVIDLGGSPSSEHGVGSSKVRWQHMTMSAVEARTLRAIKTALDPRGLLNPGVLIPAEPEK